MTQKEYHDNEVMHALKRIESIKKAPLADRKAGKADYLELLKLPEELYKRASWLLGGEFGYGEMILARRSIEGRGNKIARLSCLIAAFEDCCTAVDARKAWKFLTPEEQAAANTAIEVAIKDYLAIKEEEEHEKSANS